MLRTGVLSRRAFIPPMLRTSQDGSRDADDTAGHRTQSEGGDPRQVGYASRDRARAPGGSMWGRYGEPVRVAHDPSRPA